MSDLIRREDVINALKNSPYCYDYWLYIKGIINSIPSAEPKHGKWLPLFNGAYTGGAYWFECSECKEVVAGGLQSENRFCKGCGAKMEDGK